MILSCKEIQKVYGIHVILEKVNFHIEEKEKVAVVGVNGAGKTTLFRILTQQIAPDDGTFYFRKDATMGYLAQNQELIENRTIYEEMMEVFKYLQEMERNLREMENKMGMLIGEELSDNMEQYSRLQHKFEQNDGYGYESRIKGVLKGLGFTETEYSQPIMTLSGGQKTRVYLGKLLLSKPDLLLLDEPTNHLDIASLEWLEGFLRGYEGAVLIISHDRFFLDRIVTKVVEIENRKSKVYNGNYSFFASQKESDRENQQKAYTEQQKEIKHQEDVIKKLRSFNREKSVKRAESREKSLQKMDKVERPEDLPNKMRLTLTPKIQSGSDVLFAEDLSKSFPDKTLFEKVSFDIKREEKVAIIGPNGVGKSTLFRMLLGSVSTDSGHLRMGTNVHVGYYDQEQQNLNEDKTIFQEISDTYPNMDNGQIRTVLAAFVFTGDEVYQTISSLSGGEKGRVSLAKIMLSNANLLMLDEPTNHLDMYSKEILENAINCYQGTLLYISHDRYFINKTAQKILELTPTGVISYWGNYQYYLEKKAERQQEEVDRLAKNPEEEEIVLESETKIDWKKQKEQQAKERKIASQIAKVEEQIHDVEEKIKALEELLFHEEISCDVGKTQDIFKEKTELESRLETVYEEWEKLQEMQE